jgi:hypothetical protein
VQHDIVRVGVIVLSWQTTLCDALTICCVHPIEIDVLDANVVPRLHTGIRIAAINLWDWVVGIPESTNKHTVITENYWAALVEGIPTPEQIASVRCRGATPKLSMEITGRPSIDRSGT